MRYVLRITLIAATVNAVAALGNAQPPEEPRDGAPQQSVKPSTSNAAAVDAIVARMMAFDKNKDGKLTKDEITDPRLHRLFDRADTNQDGIVTREELTALARRMVAESGADRSGRRGPGGGGFGPGGGGFGPGPGGGFFGGPGGPGGNRGPGPRPRPGELLPPRAKELLSLSADQQAKIDALQKEVDAKLEKILTEKQKQQLKDMKSRGGDGPPPPPGEDGPPSF